MLERAFRTQRLKSLQRLTIVRTLMFAALLIWLYFNYGSTIALENTPIMALFIANGLAAYVLFKRHPNWIWVPYVIMAIDAILLGYTLLAPGRTYPDMWPWATVLRQPSFLYFVLLLALATLSLQPLLVLWAGTVSVAVWLVGTWLIINDQQSITSIPQDPSQWLDVYLSPGYVHMDDAMVRAFVTMIISIILAIAVHRARELVQEQAEAARERANLARYVAPNLVEQLASTDRPMGDARSLDVAVLFADIKDFTTLAEQLGPQATMEFLRRFHGQMAETIFDHHGTLDKFIGDGLMATFGTPRTLEDDASRAINCALAMIEASAFVDGFPAPNNLKIGIGIHYGSVTIGDIGGAGRFEFAVIGDAVNVASRVERLTRKYDTSLLISGDLVNRARAEGYDLSGFDLVTGAETIRGRSEPIEIWSIWQPGNGTGSAKHN